jgi:hypothetical protein
VLPPPTFIMKTSTFPTHEDMEWFATEYLHIDYADFYELYYGLNEEDEVQDELTQTKFEF